MNRERKSGRIRENEGLAQVFKGLADKTRPPHASTSCWNTASCACATSWECSELPSRRPQRTYAICINLSGGRPARGSVGPLSPGRSHGPAHPAGCAGSRQRTRRRRQGAAEARIAEWLERKGETLLARPLKAPCCPHKLLGRKPAALRAGFRPPTLEPKRKDESCAELGHLAPAHIVVRTESGKI
jgi:hypothetical protein